jgi:hypothetical protein
MGNWQVSGTKSNTFASAPAMGLGRLFFQFFQAFWGARGSGRGLAPAKAGHAFFGNFKSVQGPLFD